jgi:hypothetical protein
MLRFSAIRKSDTASRLPTVSKIGFSGSSNLETSRLDPKLESSKEQIAPDPSGDSTAADQ